MSEPQTGEIEDGKRESSPSRNRMWALALVFGIPAVGTVAIAIAFAALGPPGCDGWLRFDPEQLKQLNDELKHLTDELNQEIAREVMVNHLGPTIIASIVGTSAPGGGSEVLKGLSTDAMWRLRYYHLCQKDSKLKHVPSPLEMHEPNQRLKPFIDFFRQ